MTAYKDIATNKETAAKEVAEQRLVLRPAVDIFENGESIELYADVPGVTEEGLSVEVDGKTLTVQGDIQIDMPNEMRSLYADVRSTRYQRAFTLSDELDTGAIRAELNDGVLAVTIPKKEEVRPRKIEVSVG
ncbi:MAG: Hsp20/alpha crystallin family protein [Halioglobus sp.]|nr:Hsp20/alpha crystallin family protein [Halioglobus sp.]